MSHLSPLLKQSSKVCAERGILLVVSEAEVDDAVQRFTRALERVLP